MIEVRAGREGNVVLIADDNMFIRFLVQKWLGPEADIVEVGNGSDVLATYMRTKPDLVLLDIHLPGKSGKDLLTEMMQTDPEAFVVMLSADSVKENVVFSIKAGAKAFITKPFTRETLQRYFALCPTVVRTDAANEGNTAETASTGG